MIDLLNYQKSIEGPNVTRTYSQSTSQQAGLQGNSGNYLKYITRKEKTERFLSNAKPRAQPFSDFDQDIFKSIPHQYQPIPEEQYQGPLTEQNFRTNFDEESPKRLSVRMASRSPKRQEIKASMSPKEQTRKLAKGQESMSSEEQYCWSPKEQTRISTKGQARTSSEGQARHKKSQPSQETQKELSKTEQLVLSTSIRNDPTFEEKNFVKTNFDAYYRTPERFQGEEDERLSGEKVPNAFDLRRDGAAKDEALNESFIERLNEKYRRAYLEANGLDDASRKNFGKGPSVSGAVIVHEIPFVDDDVARDNRLIARLMAPQIDDLAHVHDRTGPFSEESASRLRESTSADQSKSMRKGNMSPTPQLKQSKAKKESNEKRRAYVNGLIEFFDQQYIQIRPEKIEELKEEYRRFEEERNASPTVTLSKFYQKNGSVLK